MDTVKKIKLILVHRDKTQAELAKEIGETPHNFNNKMKRANFREKSLREIADVLNCDLQIQFVMRDTGEVI